MPKQTIPDDLEFDDFGKPDECREILFSPPEYQPIEPPANIDTDEKLYRYESAVHEVGHALCALIVCKEVKCLTVAFINATVRGSAFSEDAFGEDAAIIDIGGVAAEQLVNGAGDCISHSQVDIYKAKEHLRDIHLPESQIVSVMNSIHKELQRVFATDWIRGIKLAAEKLSQVGILDGNSFVELMARGQRDAYLGKSFTLENNLLSLKKCLSNAKFELLNKSTNQGNPMKRHPTIRTNEVLFVKSNKPNPYQKLHKALGELAERRPDLVIAQLHKETSEPGIGAHEVARREVMRNHADLRARG
ncbi:MAG: hypothetical protein WCL29_03465 [Pseudomonadota bacterium]